MARKPIYRRGLGSRIATALSKGVGDYASLQQNRAAAPRIKQFLESVHGGLGDMVSPGGTVHPLTKDILDYYGTQNKMGNEYQKLFAQFQLNLELDKDKQARKTAMKLISSSNKQSRKQRLNLLKTYGVGNPDLLTPNQQYEAIYRGLSGKEVGTFTERKGHDWIPFSEPVEGYDYDPGKAYDSALDGMPAQPAQPATPSPSSILRNQQLTGY